MRGPGRIAVVCPDNGHGLSHDLRVVTKVVRNAGHDVIVVDPGDAKLKVPVVDVVIFSEIVDRRMCQLGAKLIIIPNPEYWNTEWNDLLQNACVLAKTRDTQRIFGQLCARVRFCGFAPNDHWNPTIRRRREFLHITGQSHVRLTTKLVNTWAKHPEWPRLTVVYSHAKKYQTARNIRLIHRYISAGRLRYIQNRILFHVCISQYEGFGHTFWEALSCGAVVLTNNSAPMDEIVDPESAIMIPTRPGPRMQLAQLSEVEARDIETAVKHALAMDAWEIARLQRNARSKISGRAMLFESVLLDEVSDI